MDADRFLAWCGVEFCAMGIVFCVAFDFGESIDTMLDVSMSDFDDKKMLDTLPTTDYYLKELKETEKSIFMDFGNGLPVEPDESFLYAQ